MGVIVRQRPGKSGWWVMISHQGRRKAVKVGSKRAAEMVRDKIDAMLKLGLSAEALGPAPAPSALADAPRLRDALPEWIDRKERAGDIRGSTPKSYKSRLVTWVYPHLLPDGRLLGDLPVNAITREMLGAVILRVKEAGRSLGIIEGIRNPLRGYYAELIETKVLPGPNPAADLRFFVGKRAHRKPQQSLAYFSQEEGPQLVGTAKAMFPRWAPFIMTGLLAGLRWGESAALVKGDIDWRRGRIHVQRTYSEKAGAVLPCKNSESRWVKASPALLEALRAHVAAMELEGQVKGWDIAQRQLVFPTPSGRITHHGHFLEHVWRPLLSKAGLAYRKYHATRHTFATWLLEGGADIRWVQGQLGHASIAQTADTYGHVAPEHHESAVVGLDRYLTI
jgi:integrase